MSNLYVTGEHIHAGTHVVVSAVDGKAYAAASDRSAGYLGVAIEELREGLCVIERDGEVREDDA